MIYLYAITDRPEAPLPVLPGLGEAPLFDLVYRDIAAVASQIALPDSYLAVLMTESNLWQHEAVVEALMAGRAVLPVSFGAVLADEAALQAILATRHTGFVTDLRRVSGRVELSVHVLGDEEEQGSKGAGEQGSSPTPLLSCKRESGHAYMLARLEAERQTQARRRPAEALAASLHACLDGLAVESTHRILITPRLLLKAAYLVPREGVADFLAEVENLRLAYPSLRFLCTGPWPPYSFVTNDAAAAQSLVTALMGAVL